ncbi:MAG: N-6 DNA methylase, partial [Anaerolineales bacterium]|nr:N-6 DNA methylase [Anaerolineales bacterium]
NIIAREIEKVIDALTSRHFSRHDFLQNLDRFYGAIETTAATIDEFSEKQDFLNTVYENFFQGFSVKVADTHGIVYTPQPIVDFMVRSVDDILKREFGKANGLAGDGVAILDPFVGTGNFILRVMRQMPKSQLPHKYAGELFCNEVMLLPYYIASMNIEHEYYELTGRYQPFEGISLVDTFELAEGRQMPLFAPENTQRVQRQKNTPIFVIIGNPPYNAGQVNENDNNKNRKYPAIDSRVAETYAQDSKATNKNALSDVYVKAIRWATDRLADEGIVAFVTNSSFVDNLAFDGMRKNLGQDFNRLYVLDLKGNIRKDSMRDGIPLGEEHTVFGLAAMVGVAVTFFVKANHLSDHAVYYCDVNFRATRSEKFEILEKAGSYPKLEWKKLSPDRNHTWLTDELHSEYQNFLPIGSKTVKAGRDNEAIFVTFSRGAETARDVWAYNFNSDDLTSNISLFIETFNGEVDRWHNRINRQTKLDNFVINDDTKIKWSSRLKECLRRGQKAEFTNDKFRQSIYRPFSKQYLFFDDVLTHRQGQLPSIFPNLDSEEENRVICVVNEAQIPFSAQITNCIPALHYGGRQTQCFPFYTYAA